MTNLNFDVAAIGNALVDIIANSDDAFLKDNQITKGAMTLIDAARAEKLYTAAGPAVESSGGSAANTIAGIASLGGKTAFMGKVKDDQLGKIYRHDLQAQGVHFATRAVPANSNAEPTGHCIIFVTPDAERSMNTFLGVSVAFEPDDIVEDIIKNSAVTYLEGYLFDQPEAKKAFRQAAKIARDAGKKLALTLSDVFCVERHRDEFRDLVKNHVDILFANEGELKSLYQVEDVMKAIEIARKECTISVTTRGKQGAIIVSGNETVTVSVAPVAKVVDTTGAGDLFAGGFLYGYTQGKSLAEAGRIGAIAAAEVISHYGPRPQVKLHDLI